MITTLSDNQQDVNTLRETGYQKGESTGFECLDEIMSLKRGYPLFIAGMPHSGKTEFVLELLMSASERFGWKHCVYLGETGTKAEIFGELCHKFIGKPFMKLLSKDKENQYAMSDEERMEAEVFVNNHFYICDPDGSYKFEDFYTQIRDYELQFGIEFDTTLFDPFFDFEMRFDREDLYLKDKLKTCKKDAFKHKRINILVHHIADIAPLYHKETKRRYYPIAMPNEWAGGRTWFRRAFTMLQVYRPMDFMTNSKGDPVMENETWILNQKAKPKGTGKIGQVSLAWDWKRSRFYEPNLTGNRYAGGKVFKDSNPETEDAPF